mmetsp:Transcript_82870/g.238123  ORF Transcript_82870/g.238123 Transcript_82870/m.238123 type:complete len:243 (-) Transcript_82870:833-1561(-)
MVLTNSIGSVPGGHRESNSAKGIGVSGGMRPGCAKNCAKGSSAAWPMGRSRSSKICFATVSIDSGKQASSLNPGGVVLSCTGSQSEQRELQGRTQNSLPSKFWRNSCGSFDIASTSCRTLVFVGQTANKRSKGMGRSAGQRILSNVQRSLLVFTSSPPSLNLFFLSASETARFQSASAVRLSRQCFSCDRRCSSESKPPESRESAEAARRSASASTFGSVFGAAAALFASRSRSASQPFQTF